MAEQAEEQKDKGDDSVEAQAGDDDLELTPQQQEALRILVDLVELQA
jgi:hypothetical protein